MYNKLNILSLYHQTNKNNKIMNNNKQQQLYYSTNSSLRTVYKIRQERQAKIDYIQTSWNEINHIISKNWSLLYNNAFLLAGQTATLGFNVVPVDADYYAPERVWIYFRTPSGVIAIEFHEIELLKKVNDVKIDDARGILNFTNEMAFVNRALAILL